MKDIEDGLESLAEHLPDGYQVTICVEKGAAYLEAVTSDGDVVPINGDGESCWAMLLGEALKFCRMHQEEND